jgi:hypothetical protein
MAYDYNICAYYKVDAAINYLNDIFILLKKKTVVKDINLFIPPCYLYNDFICMFRFEFCLQKKN